jgi:uncharacterized protein (DUF4415 family)
MTKKMFSYDFDPADPPPLTEEQRAELARLAAMRDEDIDLTDMPEKLDWSNAERGKFYRPVKQQLTLRLDADVVHWFKTHAKGGGYQTRINQALRDYVEAEGRKAG